VAEPRRFDVPWWARGPIAAGIAMALSAALTRAGAHPLAVRRGAAVSLADIALVGAFAGAVAAANIAVADLGRRRQPLVVAGLGLGFGAAFVALLLVYRVPGPAVWYVGGALGAVTGLRLARSGVRYRSSLYAVGAGMVVCAFLLTAAISAYARGTWVAGFLGETGTALAAAELAAWLPLALAEDYEARRATRVDAAALRPPGTGI
jgi:hypothetical protein